MKPWPLRRKIAAWSALATGFALLTFGVAITATLYQEHIEAVEDNLAASANLVAARHKPGEPLDLNILEALTTRPKRRREANTTLYGFAIVRESDGSVLQAHPAAMREAALPWPPAKHHFTRWLDGNHVRVGSFPMGDTRLLLAASLAGADESVRDLLEASLIAIPLVLLVVAGGSWWIARRALHPVREITSAAAAITTSNLSARLPEVETDDEISAHVRVLNEMFDRLQRGFEQATRFTADAAHELRTPLTILRGQLEDGLRANNLSVEQERLLVDLLEETTGLQKIADNLLLLARFDTGRGALEREPLDLSKLLVEASEDAELLAAPRSITVVAEIAPGLRVRADATMLRRVALNLIDNAIKFNRVGGTVRLALRVAGETAEIVVGNSGRGIPPDRRATLFQRFYRADSGRNREAGGSGLGLSLCREIVLAHDGEISLSGATDDWTEFTVRLPRV